MGSRSGATRSSDWLALGACFRAVRPASARWETVASGIEKNGLTRAHPLVHQVAKLARDRTREGN